MTIIFQDGQVGSTMETAGDLSAWTGTGTYGGAAAPSVETGSPHHGVYNAKFVSADADDSSWIYKTITATAICSIRGYYQWSANPSVNLTEIRLIAISGTDYVAYAGLQKSGGNVQWYMSYLKNGATVTLTANVTPSINTYYALELYVKVHATAGSVAFYVNGVSTLSDSNFDNDNYGNVVEVKTGQEWENNSYVVHLNLIV